MTSPVHEDPEGPGFSNATASRIILLLGLVAAGVYTWLALQGDLRPRVGSYLAAHAVLLAILWTVYRLTARTFPARTVLVCAVVFRLVAALGAPALSDDVYRYVWDGRVQTAGVHPYVHAPDDPALESLRDADWSSVNHPELKTIYPPVAESLFALLAALGLGPTGFRLVLGGIDVGVILLLDRLSRRRGLPRRRLLLYAWHPLAVMETAGSGHLEPLGVALVLAALTLLEGRRPGAAGLALGAAIQTKLLPLIVAPWLLMRGRFRLGAGVVAAVVLSALPYALTGPWLGAGLVDYAERWRYNAFGFAALESFWTWLDAGETFKGWIATLQQWPALSFLPYDWMLTHVWPPELARLTAGGLLLAALAWIWTRGPDDGVLQARACFGALLLLMPTVHPWYVLWILPFAALTAAPAWLWLAAVVPLAYVEAAGDVPWPLRCVQYLPLWLMLLFPPRADAVRKGPDR